MSNLIEKDHKPNTYSLKSSPILSRPSLKKNIAQHRFTRCLEYHILILNGVKYISYHLNHGLDREYVSLEIWCSVFYKPDLLASLAKFTIRSIDQKLIFI